MPKKIKSNELAQYRHALFLKKVSEQSSMAYKIIIDSIIKKIKKNLRAEKLAKSDELDEGWTEWVPSVEIDLNDVIGKVIDRQFQALRWILLGDYAGKEARDIAKELGLVGKVVPGIIPAAYLQSIDAQREHFQDTIGEDPAELSRQIVKASLDKIVTRSEGFIGQSINQIKLNLMEVVDKLATENNIKNQTKAMKAAHNDPSTGLKEISEDLSAMLNVKKIESELREVTDKMQNKVETLVDSETGYASAAGSHQTLVEVYGAKDDNIKCAWIMMEDEKTCSWCHDASKNPDGSYKIYSLKDVKPAGYNYGKKKSEWKITAGKSHPRCYTSDMSVFTNEGWKLWPEINGNEIFLSVNLDTGNAEWVKAKKLIREEYCGIIEHRYSLNADFNTTPNHSHVIRTVKKQQWRLVDGKNLPKSASFLASIPNWSGASQDNITIAGETFNTIDFCRFLGIYISEGNTIIRKKSAQIKITQEKYYDEFVSVAERLFNKIWKGEKAFYIPLTNKPELAKWFSSLGKSWEKHIPIEIKNLNKEYLEELLKYIALGDGSIRKNRMLPGQKKETYSVLHYTSSYKLMSDLCEIILKCGRRPSFSLQEAKIVQHKNGLYMTKHPCWRIVEGIHQAYSGAVKKIDVFYNGYIHDVELEKNHTLIVSRNGKVVVSGNCRCELVYIPKGFEIDPEGSIRPIKKT